MNLLLILPGFIVAFASILLYELDRRKLCKELSLYRKLSSSSKNNVHFYVTCELNHHRGEIIHTLWLGEPYRAEDGHFKSDCWSSILGVNDSFVAYNLNYSDFEDMKEGEIREVFINLDD